MISPTLLDLYTIMQIGGQAVALILSMRQEHGVLLDGREQHPGRLKNLVEGVACILNGAVKVGPGCMLLLQTIVDKL